MLLYYFVFHISLFQGDLKYLIEFFYFSNNLLYPTEDKEDKSLKFNCRICDYVEDSNTGDEFTEEGPDYHKFCVYRNELKKEEEYV